MSEKMTKVTNAIIKTADGQQVKSDAFGNNIAILCPNCSKAPILIIALKNQRGSSSNNPATCKECGKSFSIISNLNEDAQNEIIINAS